MLDCPNHETEIKFKLDNAGEYDALILTLNTRFGMKTPQKVFEVNILYDRNGELKDEDKVLRIRKEYSSASVVETPKYILTYKGPATDSENGIKSRSEYNLTVAPNIEDVLKGLGYKESLRYEKFRITYPQFSPRKVDGQFCELVVDHLPNVGYFVEIEGPSEEVINEAVKELGFWSMKVESKSYASIIRNFGKKK